MAKAEGLDFDFEKAVVANTRNAHRLIHLAKESGKGDEMKERLLKAYFLEGKNVDDFESLKKLGQEVGLKAEKITETLNSEKYEESVAYDIYESRQIGVQGVPFFVLDRKFGISGAQANEVFDQTLEKAWNDFIKENPTLEIVQGNSEDSCDIDGDC